MAPSHPTRGASSRDLELLRENLDDFWRVVKIVVPSTIFFAAIICIATLGYLLLGWPLFDAFYMVIITVFSVGYGEIHPVNTVAERVWTVLVILAGWSGVVVTLGGLTRAITEGELRRASDSVRKLRKVQHLENHVIICGYGRMGATLAKELQAAKIPFVILDRDEERVAQIQVDGFLAVKGDATDEAILELAGIKRARFLATVLPQDALNVFITLTARNLSHTIKILARGEQPSTEKKLLQAGASEVILPAQIGAHRIANSIIEPDLLSIIKDGAGGLDLHGMGIEIDELTVHDHSHLVGKTIGEIGKICGGEVMILAVRRGPLLQRDHLDGFVLRGEDALIAISKNKNLPAVLGRDVEKMELL